MAALAIQAAVLVYLLVIADRPDPDARRLAVGDTLTSLSGTLLGASDESIDLTGRQTALLAFSASCHFCDSVAPRWSQWINERAPNARPKVLGITRDPPSLARAYLSDYGIQIPIISLYRISDRESRGLTGRTPWITVFNRRGVLRHSVHGSRITLLDSLDRPGPDSNSPMVDKNAH